MSAWYSTPKYELNRSVTSSKSSGLTSFNNGILILTYIPMGAPNNYTVTDTLSISSDCSTIAIKGERYSYNLNQQ